MSGAMENRAAVFTSSPQDVEVYRDGGWWAGSLLGWRHDAAGGCQVWVRLAVRGLEETSWLGLDLLRLPEPVAAPAAPPAAPEGGDCSLTGTMAAIRAVPAPRTRTRPEIRTTAELAATATMVAVRDLDELASRPTGGRRRAPGFSTGEHPVVAAPGVGPSPGRHRAPGSVDDGSAGRHRAADTGVWPAVRVEEPVRLTELPRGGLSAAIDRLPADEPDSHLLTRPMRLGNPLDGAVPQPRAALRDGRLSGV